MVFDPRGRPASDITTFQSLSVSLRTRIFEGEGNVMNCLIGSSVACEGSLGL